MTNRDDGRSGKLIDTHALQPLRADGVRAESRAESRAADESADSLAEPGG